jgi:hypothetical protein
VNHLPLEVNRRCCLFVCPSPHLVLISFFYLWFLHFLLPLPFFFVGGLRPLFPSSNNLFLSIGKFYFKFTKLEFLNGDAKELVSKFAPATPYSTIVSSVVIVKCTRTCVAQVMQQARSKRGGGSGVLSLLLQWFRWISSNGEGSFEAIGPRFCNKDKKDLGPFSLDKPKFLEPNLCYIGCHVE